jgi:hypothetical protein
MTNTYKKNMLESLQKLLSDWGIDQAEQLGLLDADDIKQLSDCQSI